MKHKALFKDTFREIGRSKTRFISIFAIILLGVAFYAGLSATGPVMVHTADTYFTDHNLSDVHLFSTMGLEEEDKERIDSLEDASSEFMYSMDVVFDQTGLNSRVYGHSNESESLNQNVIHEGRLPENSGEIALDSTMSYMEEYSIGDTIQIEEGTSDEFEESFEETTFEVVGFVQNPQFIERTNRGNTQVGTGSLDGYSIVMEEDFALDVYTDAFVLFDQSENLEAYSQEYNSFVDDRIDEIEQLLEDRPAERYEELSQEIEEEIDDGYQEIEEARQELTDAEEEIEEARADIEQGYQVYESGLAELESEEASARNELENERNQLLEAQAEIDLNRQQLENAPIENPALMAELDAQEQQVNAGLEQINQAEAELDAEIESARNELEAARVELEEAETELVEAEEEFEAERLSAEEEIEEATADLQEAEEELADLDEPEYFVEDRSSFPGYSEFDENAERINAIARIFPVFFFLLAALISLTTMTRMVDEGRNQIGTFKALGYNNVSISMKYFTYAFIATVTGAVLGLLIGFWLFPTIIVDAYSSMYNMPSAETQFYWNYALISLIGGLLATGLSTLISVRLSLRSNAAALLRPKAPKKGKRIFLEYMPFLWKRFSFTQKVASRNLFRYKRRMLMTIFGVAGGTALLLTGFGLSDSIANIGEIQFGEINQYQAMVAGDPDASEEQIENFEETLSEVDGIEDEFRVSQENATAERSDETQEVNVLVPSDVNEMDDFIVLRDLEDEENVHELPEEGAIITDKLAELLDVSVGETIQIDDEEAEAFEVEVTAVVEQYLDHYVYLSPEAYENAANEQAEFSMRMLKYDEDNIDEDELGQVITDEEAIQGVVFTSNIHEAFQDSMDSLDVVTVVLIVSAASLAFVVLYNLTNINVSERIRELSTIKVLGFFDKEVTMYVYRENFVLTILAILAGFVLGFFMHGLVIQTAEVDMMRFARDIMASSYLYSFLLMFFFSSLVMVAMHFKLKRIDMVEALKTVE